MNILFVHQNVPAQYQHLAPALVRRGHQVRALCMRKPLPELKGATVQAYTVQRKPATQLAPLLQNTESKLLRAEAVAAACARLAQQGFEPDIICACSSRFGASYYRILLQVSVLLCSHSAALVPLPVVVIASRLAHLCFPFIVLLVAAL